MASRFHGPSRGPSKASAQTRCQKCLKLGHYSYECKSSTSERPYISRPSRTQQLYNPSLAPKLAATAPPSDDALPKAGLADSILAGKEKERGRKRRHGSPSRRRDESTSSMSSYSSISSSGTPEPQQPRKDVPATQDEDRSVRRKYRDSPSPRRRGRRMSPEGRRSRSRSPPRRISNVVNYIQQEQEAPPVQQQQQQQQRTGERSPSPFTRRRLLTEQMQTGGG